MIQSTTVVMQNVEKIYVVGAASATEKFAQGHIWLFILSPNKISV